MHKSALFILVLLTPVFVSAQSFILPTVPDEVYCTETSGSDVGVTFILRRSELASGAHFYQYLNYFNGRLAVPSMNNSGFAPNGGLFDTYFGENTDCAWDGVNDDVLSPTASDLLESGKAVYFVRSLSPRMMPDDAVKRKTADESISSSANLHSDSELRVAVKSGKSYTVHGAVFARAANATPDIKIAITSPTGSDMVVGYTSTEAAGSSGVLDVSGNASSRIPLPANTLVPISIDGTIVAGGDGFLQLQWGQFVSSAATLKVGKGSYFKVEEIQ